jgi:hypothetical protein
MKYSLAVGALVVVGPISGCGTMMTAPPRHFLSETVESAPNELSRPLVRRAKVTIDPARAQLGEVAWLAGPRADLTTDERGQLLDLLGTQLRSSLQKLPPAPGGRPILVRAAITRVEPVSPALNTVSTLLLVAPWDRGGAATEIEAVDAETGKQIAAIRLGFYAPMSDIKARFSKLSSAEIAIGKAVTDFSGILTPLEPTKQTARP